MFERLSNTLKKYANGWLVLLFFAGEVSFNTVILPNQQAKIEAASDGTGPIDLKLFYLQRYIFLHHTPVHSGRMMSRPSRTRSAISAPKKNPARSAASSNDSN
jgi:hypothetical protein